MSYVRMPLRRKEDLKLLRGQGCYAADIRKPGMLQAVAAAVRETVPTRTSCARSRSAA